METSLHRELKLRYAGDGARTEVRHSQYRIDALVDNELIEIQHGSLAAIRDKVRDLLDRHAVRVVKPIVAGKMLVKRSRAGGRVVEQRRSPKRGTMLDVFDELVHFTSVFPHPRLTLELLLVDVEEWRCPGHGRRRRRRQSDFVVLDRKLLAVREVRPLRTAAELLDLLGMPLPPQFGTAQIAELVGVPRWQAQRIAYCLRQTGATRAVERLKDGWRYERTEVGGQN